MRQAPVYAAALLALGLAIGFAVGHYTGTGCPEALNQTLQAIASKYANLLANYTVLEKENKRLIQQLDRLQQRLAEANKTIARLEEKARLADLLREKLAEANKTTEELRSALSRVNATIMTYSQDPDIRVNVSCQDIYCVAGYRVYITNKGNKTKHGILVVLAAFNDQWGVVTMDYKLVDRLEPGVTLRLTLKPSMGGVYYWIAVLTPHRAS